MLMSVTRNYKAGNDTLQRYYTNTWPSNRSFVYLGKKRLPSVILKTRYFKGIMQKTIKTTQIVTFDQFLQSLFVRYSVKIYLLSAVRKTHATSLEIIFLCKKQVVRVYILLYLLSVIFPRIILFFPSIVILPTIQYSWD